MVDFHLRAIESLVLVNSYTHLPERESRPMSAGHSAGLMLCSCLGWRKAKHRLSILGRASKHTNGKNCLGLGAGSCLLESPTACSSFAER